MTCRRAPPGLGVSPLQLYSPAGQHLPASSWFYKAGEGHGILRAVSTSCSCDVSFVSRGSYASSSFLMVQF